MKITFVILHYVTIEDTKECIQSILENIEYDNYEIVVVDNGSPNGTGKQLKLLYEKNKKIFMINSKENLGFAKGNNLGFKYAKYELNSKFIILINNDIIIEQPDFCKKICYLYKKHKFSIAGPKIISLVDGKNQNPIPYEMIDLKKVKTKITKLKILLFLSCFKMDNFIKKINKVRRKKNIDTINDDYQLHGSCLIFSEAYINKYEGIYKETFMYCEEDILKYLSKKQKDKMLYLKEISLYHKEDSSTNSIYKKDIEKRKFYYRNSMHSYKVLYNLMMSEKED